jgi:hypothetical protein
MTVADDLELMLLWQICRGEGALDNFWADACRVADGDEDAGHDS